MILIVSILSFTTTSSSNDSVFDQYLWNNRLIVVFTPDMNSELISKQRKVFESNAPGMHERHLVLWTLNPGKSPIVEPATIKGLTQDSSLMKSLNPNVTKDLYQSFVTDPEQFRILLIGKDGTEKLRKNNETLSHRELFNLIDSMPMRRQEMLRQ